MRDVLTLGETMMALRSSMPIRLGGSLRTSIAGAESNVAIALARLGHDVAWLGRVGSDGPGELVERTLRAEGVDVSAVVRDEHGTGVITFERRLPAVQRVAYARTGSAGSRLAVADLPAVLDARLVHVTGITAALSRSARDAVLTLCRRARDEGAGVSLDVNHRALLWSREEAAPVLRELATLADVVVASPDELTLLVPDAADADEAATALVTQGVGEVVLKDGAEQAHVVTADGRVSAAARTVTVVDAVGAGDAFTAGYLSARLEGLDLAGRLERAHLLGAFAVSVEGDWEGAPTRGELDLLDRSVGTVLR